jgi:hypothetical protein
VIEQICHDAVNRRVGLGKSKRTGISHDCGVQRSGNFRRDAIFVEEDEQVVQDLARRRRVGINKIEIGEWEGVEVVVNAYLGCLGAQQVRFETLQAIGLIGIEDDDGVCVQDHVRVLSRIELFNDSVGIEKRTVRGHGTVIQNCDDLAVGGKVPRKRKFTPDCIRVRVHVSREHEPGMLCQELSETFEIELHT